MSLFQCAKCGCRENTASSHQGFIFDTYFDWTGLEEYRGKKLCSACGPLTFKDSGQVVRASLRRGLPGVWHGQFERLYLPKDGSIFTNRVGNLESKDGKTVSELYSTTEYEPISKPRVIPDHVVRQVEALVVPSVLEKYLSEIDSNYRIETQHVDNHHSERIRLNLDYNAKGNKNRLPRGKSRKAQKL